ncbi:hypothetical protein, partial [Salmonella sp. SAL4447]|uniref:hypothetical protein n=1 Tax=Salmonella sp. SAL4447 TaxID=3159902 RepID=UPI003979763C
GKHPLEQVGDRHGLGGFRVGAMFAPARLDVAHGKGGYTGYEQQHENGGNLVAANELLEPVSERRRAGQHRFVRQIALH